MDKIRFLEIIFYSTIYGSLSILALLLVRGLLGMKMRPKERMALWWLIVVQMVLTLTLFQKGNFTVSYSGSNFVFPPIQLDFQIGGTLDNVNQYNLSGELGFNLKLFTAEGWKVIGSGDGNLLLDTVLSVWVIGMALFWIWNILSYMVLQRRLKAFGPCEEIEILEILRFEQRFQDITGPIMVKKVPGRFIKGVNCPCVVGFSQPILVLLDEQWQKLNTDEREAVVAHELQHIKKKDNFRNLLYMMLQGVNWFNPIIWIGFKYLRRDLECLRDVQIVEALSDEQVISYAKAIVTVAKMSSRKYRSSLHSGMLCSSGVGYRIYLLKERYKKKSFLGLLSIAIIAFAMIYMVTHKETIGFISSMYYTK